jgi:hypothetical protein
MDKTLKIYIYIYFFWFDQQMKTSGMDMEAMMAQMGGMS